MRQPAALYASRVFAAAVVVATVAALFLARPSRIDYNTADAEAIATIPGFDYALARAVVRFRDYEHGGYLDRGEDAAEPLARYMSEERAECLAYRLAVAAETGNPGSIDCPLP